MLTTSTIPALTTVPSLLVNSHSWTGLVWLVVRTTLLVDILDNVEVVVIHVITSKDIGDKVQDSGLSNPSPSKKKDCVWCLRLVLCVTMTPFSRDSTLLEKTVGMIALKMSL